MQAVARSWTTESDHRILGRLLGRRNPAVGIISGCCRSLVVGVHTSVNIQSWRRREVAVGWPDISPIESYVTCCCWETHSKQAVLASYVESVEATTNFECCCPKFGAFNKNGEEIVHDA